MRIEKLTPQEWATLSENAHLVVFNEVRPADANRIDYALLAIGDDNIPMMFITVRELDNENVYWQFGGAFPNTRGTVKSIRAYKALINWTMSRYKRVAMLVENTNTVYLKMSLACGFIPSGIRTFQGAVLLELYLEYEGAPPHGS